MTHYMISEKPQRNVSILPTENGSSAGNSSPSGDKLSVASTTGSQTKLIQVVHSIYRHWAHFIASHTYAVIAFCSILTVLCTVKIGFTPQRNDITGYTPYGARSRDELAIRDQFFDAKGKSFGTFLLVVPKHGEDNMLQLELLEEVAKIDEIVSRNITMFNHVTNRSEGFTDFCRDFCDINEPFRKFYEGFRYQTLKLRAKEPPNPRIQLDYPQITIYGRSLNIQPNFFGIEFAPPHNASESHAYTNMEKASMIALIYKAERVGGWSDDEVKAYEMSVSHFFENSYRSNRLRVMTMSTTYVEVEVVRAGLSMLPFLAIGFLIMAVCSTTTVFLSAAYMQQASVHKFSLALMACVCPFMACGTALGLLFLAGVRFGSILCVTPFLVLAIGVDDAYLMIHTWQRVSKQMRDHPVKEDSVAHRLSLVLIDTGPAILISALTNIAADAVGSFTGSPEVTLLCLGNMAAIFVDFLYQITFFSAVMAMAGAKEMQQEARAVCYKLSIPIHDGPSNGEQIAPTATRSHGNKFFKLLQQKHFHDSMKKRVNAFVNGYVNLINNLGVVLAITVVWIAFLVFSLIGITKFEVNLTTKKLFASDSPLLIVGFDDQIIDNYREDQIVTFYTYATVFINNPGNLSNPSRLSRLNSLVHDLEHLPESWGPQSTNYFVREFLHFQKEFADEEFVGVPNEEGDLGNTTHMTKRAGNELQKWSPPSFTAEDLQKFLDWSEHTFWRAFLRMRTNERNETELGSFFFTTAFHGERLSRWPERSRLLQDWRRVVDAYPELNATVYHDEGVFLDLIENMPSNTWQSALTTLASMAAICAVFMWNTWTVLVASAIIASILIGTLGTLSWQGITLDPIMMAAAIISIGFSVDIPAHVSYHYHSSGYDDPSASVKRRLKATLSSVGFPAVQASLSTSLCVLSLLFVPLYMAQIFVRIMCSCIFLCLVHSLVVLPALFSLIERIHRIFGRLGGKSSKTAPETNRTKPIPIQN